MVTTTSLLDLIKKEDTLMKEYDKNQEREVDLLHEIDNSVFWPNYYQTHQDELQRAKNEVTKLQNRDDKIREELKRTRSSIRQYIIRKIIDI